MASKSLSCIVWKSLGSISSNTSSLFQFLWSHKTFISSTCWYHSGRKIAWNEWNYVQSSSTESDCCKYIWSFPRNSATILAWSNLRSDLLHISKGVYIQVCSQTHRFLHQNTLQNLSIVQLKWINISLPEIFQGKIVATISAQSQTTESLSKSSKSFSTPRLQEESAAFPISSVHSSQKYSE